MTLRTTEPAQAAQGSTARASPRSGRGMPLTAQQEATLVALCMARTAGNPCASQTKQFWRSVAAAFEIETGRPYSWQSCRRRMARLEDGGHVEQHRAPSPVEAVPAEPTKPTRALRSPDNDNGDDYAGEDDDLPATPTVRRDAWTGFVRVSHDARSMRVNIVDLVESGIEGFEKQLDLYTAAIIKNPHDLRKVNQAFSNFKNEMSQALDKYKRGRAQHGTHV